MPAAAPPALAENAGLAFAGEPEWTPAVVTARQVEILRAGANPSGRPNDDVLRGFLGLAGHEFRERWQIDFAPHLTEQEATLYEAPFAALEKKCRKAKSARWWINPHAHPGLRTALARPDRFLVAPINAAQPVWTWVDAGWLPDESLVAIARDDEFTQGVLQSAVFAAWRRPGGTLLALVESFPFPWPPRTAFGSLTGIQQDLRYEVARATRNQDSVQLDAVVTTAYGFPPALDAAEVLLRLQRLHRKRASGG
jgi:hypothetical protein